MSLVSGTDTVQPKPLKVAEFSPEELERFENRFENGYEIFTDEKYVAWLRQYHPDSVPQDLCDDPLNTTLNDPFNESPFDEHISQTVMEIFHRRNLNALKIGLIIQTTSSPTRNMWLGCKSIIPILHHQLQACLLQLVHWKSLQHYLNMNQV